MGSHCNKSKIILHNSKKFGNLNRSVIDEEVEKKNDERPIFREKDVFALILDFVELNC